jgi:hypothetical protein
VELNPSLSTSVAELREQNELGTQVANEIELLFDVLCDLRDVKTQSSAIVARMEKAGQDNDEVSEAAKALDEKLTTIEEKITQVKSKSGQDPINFPPMIDNQLTTLYGYIVRSDHPPTAGAYQRFEDLKPELAALRAEFQELVASDIAAFNRLVAGLDLPPVIVSAAPQTEDR